ncbi:MAG: hypothetical protein QG623_337 [Patescibacteria group bacterium]|nr:hypothetical protein [Patescibacteria group bacterium]
MKRVGRYFGRILYKKFRRYAIWPTWRLVFTSLFFFTVGIFFLRSNNLSALDKYRDVIKADQNGGSVYEKLDDLQKYTFGHINSDIGQPVQLVNTYNRDAQEIFSAAQLKLTESGATQKNIYLEAQKVCEEKGIPIAARAQCAADYALNNNPEVGKTELEVNLPDKALYSFRFSSPRFAWDAAGISLLIALIFLLGAALRTVLAWYLRKRWSSWDSKYL